MRTPWRETARDALVSGTFAAVASTAVLAAAGKRETGSVVAPTNAISHWFWGDRAAREDEPSLAHTLVGYLTHHGAAVFWALFYERWFGRLRREPVKALGGGLAVAALACFVDYQLTPRRLQPGYEMRLSKPALAGVYLAFGVGLALGAVVSARARRAPAWRRGD
jgi:hypothetical protein